MASGKQNSKKLKWSLDLGSKNKQFNELSSPPGLISGYALLSENMNKSEENDSNHLVIKKSWDQALQPLKQIPMTLFLMYMTGNSISIIPIMMSSMLIIKPVKSLFAVQKTFQLIDGKHAFGQKFVFVFGQLLNIGLALYKYHSMGLLPTHASDWLAFVEPQERVEYSGGGFIYV